ncbi:HD domain-containing protein [Saccharothrix sp. HUAS TT1]|uniref:HD domain-containing protein n=1 Tax=unclassified Saccharothrix TaxID=2593673 RepID=UPI00345BE1B3
MSFVLVTEYAVMAGRENLYGSAYGIAESMLVSLPRRWKHVLGVARRARSVRQVFSDEDADVLASAAILHDIGYSDQVKVTGFHPLDGAKFLRNQQIAPRVCALVAHHSCAYREAELRGLSSELYAWPDEGTSVRDALWWADMTTSPDGDSTNVHDRIEEIQKRYGTQNLVSVFINQAKDELIGAVERTEERLRTAGMGHLAK